MNKRPANLDPVTGPLSREEFQGLVGAPFGKATETIRQHDPFWGRGDGEKIEWKIRCRRDDDGVAYVKAASEKEAGKLAGELTTDDVEWGDSDDFEVISVEPHTPPKRR